MTGLDQIIDQIRQDAELAAEKNIQQAQQKAEQILQHAEEEARLCAQRIDETTEREKKELIARAHSAAQLEKRKRLLHAKQQIIGEIIEEAQKTLLQLPDEEYFSLLIQLVQKYALSQEGELRLSSKDLARLPASFHTALEKAIPTGGRLEISSKAAEIEGGFLLVYGGIEENCSFQALFESNRERLQDEVQKILFAG